MTRLVLTIGSLGATGVLCREKVFGNKKKKNKKKIFIFDVLRVLNVEAG